MTSSDVRIDSVPIADIEERTDSPKGMGEPSSFDGVAVFGAPESGCRAVSAWLESAGFFSVDTGSALRAADDDGEVGAPPKLRTTPWAEFILGVADGTWSEPPTRDRLIGSRVTMIPDLKVRMNDAVDCASGAPLLFSDELLLPVYPIIAPALLSRFLGILVLRNPLAIARTLSQKSGISIGEGLALWEHYLSVAFSISRSLPVLAVNFENQSDIRLFSDEIIDRIAAPSSAQRWDFVADRPFPGILAEDLWRDASDDEFLAAATQRQIAMWQVLTESANSGHPLQDYPQEFEIPSELAVEILHDGARLRADRVTTRDVRRAVEKVDALYRVKFDDQEERYATLASEYHSLNGHVAALQDVAGERDRLQAVSSELMLRVRGMAEEQAATHRRADELDREVARLVTEVERLSAFEPRAAELDRQLEAMYQSESWQIGSAITLPARRCKAALRRLLRMAPR